MFKVILMMEAGLVAVLAARFACTPDSCEGIKCPSVSPEICDANGQEYRPNSTACGCCHLCLSYLEEGEECGRPSSDVPFDGDPPRLIFHCRSPSTCTLGVCKSNATSC